MRLLIIIFGVLCLTSCSELKSTNDNTTNSLTQDNVTNWRLNSYWLGSGDTNTNSSTNGDYLCVYNFNSDNTCDYWQLTNVYAYLHTNYKYEIINGNEISNFILPSTIISSYYLDNGGLIFIDATNWKVYVSHPVKYLLKYEAYIYSNQIIVTNLYYEYSNFVFTNHISNSVTNYGPTNFINIICTNHPYLFLLSPTSNLSLPK